MEDNNYYGSYEENERKNPIIKFIIIGVALILIIALIFLLTRSCESKSINDVLLDASKKYYEQNKDSLPSARGECNTITLSYLINENMIANAEQFNSCDDTVTSVKVCKLDSGAYHYTPVISCGTKEDTVFGDYKEGKESDLVADSSDVRFKFLGEVYSSKEKQYYPNNLTDASKVVELYTASPAGEYTYKSEAVKDAAKWYKEVSTTSYWNNGGYSSVAPAGYPTQGKEGTPITKVSLTAPATASYRTINQTKLYRTRVSLKSEVRYDCQVPGDPTKFITNSKIPCAARTDSYTGLKARYEVCGDQKVENGAGCPATEWSAWSTTACTTTDALECESKTGYTYTDRTWQWYVSGSHRSYYPSGSASATGEKTYYTSVPAAGYVKDTTTVTTAYKFYKLVDSDKGTEGEWIKLSENYMESEELLTAFKEKGFEVKTLNEIEKNKEIRYSLQLEYANKE